MNVPKAFVHQKRFDSEIRQLERALAPQVIHVRYTLGNDWSGEPAVFFRLLLADASTRRDQLWDITDKASMLIVQQLEPLEQWGVLPYFSFRSQSEQAQINEPAWA